MAPCVHEEIFLLNHDTKTIANYVTIVEYPACRLIGMLAGPQTMSSAEARETEAMLDDVGYRSQQVFTQEKYVYLYY